MGSGNGETTSRADRLGEILGAYFVAVEAGQAPSRQELLAQHPELAAELAEYFGEQDRLDRMVAPLRPPAQPDSTALDGLSGELGAVPHVLLRDTEPAADGDPLLQPHSPEMPPLADRPARLQLFGEIARGGMGAILKGRDVDLGRELAAKVLLEAHQGSPDVVRRFVEEAQIGGQLQHPGIVPVYELGTFPDRRPYFAMKLVHGRTLSSLLAERAHPGADDKPEARAKVRSGEPSSALQACEKRAADLPRFLSIFEHSLPDDGLCPRPGRDPSRSEAGQCDGGRVRRGPGDGLGPGQGPAAGRNRRRDHAGERPRGDRRYGTQRFRRRRLARRLRAWEPRRTWHPSRRAVSLTASMSAPTSSVWGRYFARSSPASRLFLAVIETKSVSGPYAANWGRPIGGLTAVAQIPSWSLSAAIALQPNPPRGRGTPAKWPIESRPTWPVSRTACAGPSWLG